MALEFDMPATYLLRVKGYLDSSWSERLGGMSIRGIDLAEGTAETILVGQLPDQAALCGVLCTLYDNRFPLLSVEYLGPVEH